MGKERNNNNNKVIWEKKLPFEVVDGFRRRKLVRYKSDEEAHSTFQSFERGERAGEKKNSTNLPQQAKNPERRSRDQELRPHVVDMLDAAPSPGRGRGVY